MTANVVAGLRPLCERGDQRKGRSLVGRGSDAKGVSRRSARPKADGRWNLLRYLDEKMSKVRVNNSLAVRRSCVDAKSQRSEVQADVGMQP